jgi:hypothetical protein
MASKLSSEIWWSRLRSLMVVDVGGLDNGNKIEWSVGRKVGSRSQQLEKFSLWVAGN